MKENNQKVGNYYLGLDLGTDSLGWAVTDLDYNIKRFKGKSMWGVRLFEEANTSAERRTQRESRRRLERRKERLLLLELLFNNAIAENDPNFFKRMHESSLYLEDKTGEKTKYSVFADPDFTDKDYHKKYPTVYHLRSELVHSKDVHDARLVFLALHSILKARGHFLFSGTSGDAVQSVAELFNAFKDSFSENYEKEFSPDEESKYIEKLTDFGAGITAKKKSLRDNLTASKKEKEIIAFSDLLAGAKVKITDLFGEEYKDAGVSSIALSGDVDEEIEQLVQTVGDKADVLVCAKALFDRCRLDKILAGNSYISDAKIALYKKNGKDLQALKVYIKANYPEKKKEVFNAGGAEKNYAAYSDGKCTQEEFCEYLCKNVIKEVPEEDSFYSVYQEIKDKVFLTKLRTSDNGVIPNQLNRAEYVKIIENASAYLSFLNDQDGEGITVSQKLISIFDYKIPYYVGPLNPKAKNYWAERAEGKIYPWNFEQKVNLEKSAENFMTNLIGRCTFTGEPVLPKDSLLYSEFAVLNLINAIKVNDSPISNQAKQIIFDNLFVNSSKKVTKKAIHNELVKACLIEKGDEISGIDDIIPLKLKSLHDFREILDKTEDYNMVERIIEHIIIFGDDKKMLKVWISKNCHDLSEKDVDYICRLKYTEWGNLSGFFLTGLQFADEDGVVYTVMEAMRENCLNLGQLLSNRFDLAENAAKYRKTLLGEESLNDKLANMYIPPKVQRSIRQALRATDEIVGIEKAAPKKIFVEVARGDEKKERTVSRKDRLVDLYKACKQNSGELFNRLLSETEDSLRRDKLYLYYTQFGKCMYSGEPIDIAALDAKNGNVFLYDIDHIFPRSRIKDDSIDNRVLVKAELNRDKTNAYPISEDIRTRMLDFWQMLRAKDLISEKKFERLKRNYPLTEDELSAFVNRQLVETRQSTKALVNILKELYPKSRIVCSKAGNVSEFRQTRDILKNRSINDLHHAKDAYLNIVVGNVYDTKFTEKFFKNITRENYSLRTVFDYDVAGAWKKDKSIAIVKKNVYKNNILFTRMPHKVKGALYDVQVLSKGNGQLPKKRNLPIEKYGGYNKIQGAFFAVVEHDGKKNERIRTIEPVYAYQADNYFKDPEAYMANVLGLKNSEIVEPCILKHSILELDGERLYISGRTGDSITYKNGYPLIVSYAEEKYLKTVDKFVERVNKKLDVTGELAALSKEKNEQCYENLFRKMQSNAYKVIFKNKLDDLSPEKFKSLAVESQAQVLSALCKGFNGTVQTVALKSLDTNVLVEVRKNKNLSNLRSAVLVNASVTGLFEYRRDLLKQE